MTNAMIILTESVKLMEQGLLKPTGEKLRVEDAEGNVKELDVPEEIHTYAKWKEQGFQVQKGQKSNIQFPIWKYVRGKQKAEAAEEVDGEAPENQGYCRMVNAYFFTKAQVQPIQPAMA